MGRCRQTTAPKVGTTVEREIAAYNTYDLPLSGSVNGTPFAIDYTANGDRFRKTVGTGAEATTTTYFGALYERRTSSEGVLDVFKVYAETGLAAQIEMAGATTTTKTIVPDLAGSPGSMLTAGEEPTHLFYEPNGQRTTIAGNLMSTAEAQGIHDGLTGHEHDLDLDLINMGGRVYDPTLRRFLTPDPFPGHPESGEMIDPYLHVGGDPVNLIDPTGYYYAGAGDYGDGEPDGDADDGAYERESENQYAQEEAREDYEAQQAAAEQAEAYADLASQQDDELDWNREEAVALADRTLSKNKSKRIDNVNPNAPVRHNPKKNEAEDKEHVSQEPDNIEQAEDIVIDVAVPEYRLYQAIIEGDLGAIAGYVGAALALKALGATIVAAIRSAPPVAPRIANAANHIFGPKALGRHNLDTVLGSFNGDAVAAFNALEGAAQQLANKGTIKGVFETTVEVAGQTVTVRGAVIDGVAKVATAFIPGG
ncbi:MAG: RHS repeat-associated core domain-containing protein [Polyangiaceae bacterium]